MRVLAVLLLAGAVSAQEPAGPTVTTKAVKESEALGQFYASRNVYWEMVPLQLNDEKSFKALREQFPTALVRVKGKHTRTMKVLPASKYLGTLSLLEIDLVIFDDVVSRLDMYGEAAELRLWLEALAKRHGKAKREPTLIVSSRRGAKAVETYVWKVGDITVQLREYPDIHGNPVLKCIYHHDALEKARQAAEDE